MDKKRKSKDYTAKIIGIILTILAIPITLCFAGMPFWSGIGIVFLVGCFTSMFMNNITTENVLTMFIASFFFGCVLKVILGILMFLATIFGGGVSHETCIDYYVNSRSYTLQNALYKCHQL
jgi:F0F1-type ATP synthase assembly protein I